MFPDAIRKLVFINHSFAGTAAPVACNCVYRLHSSAFHICRHLLLGIELIIKVDQNVTFIIERKIFQMSSCCLLKIQGLPLQVNLLVLWMNSNKEMLAL